MQLYEALYNSYLDINEKKMNLKNFISDCIKETKSNFFDFQDNYLNKITNKIKMAQEKIDNSKCLLQNEIENKENLKKIRLEQIQNKKFLIQKEKEEDKLKLSEINNTIPSTEFTNKLFKNSNEMFEARNKIEDQFSADPKLMTHIAGKTRFGGNPPHKDTFYITCMDKKGSMYLTEKDRFNIIGIENKTSFLQEDKQKRQFLKEQKLKRNANFYKGRAIQSKNDEIIFDYKALNAGMKRTMRLYDYELRNNIRNELLE